MLKAVFKSESGGLRFSERRRQWPALSSKTRIGRLRAQEAGGIASRTIYTEVPPLGEHRLTERGWCLWPIFQIMKEWVRMESSPAAPAANLS